MQKPESRKCIQCGIWHNICIEEMETGKLEPLDKCKHCLLKYSLKPLDEKIILKNEWEVKREWERYNKDKK